MLPRHRMFGRVHLAFALVASLLLPGCFGGDYVSITSVHDLGRDPDTNVIRVGAGEIFVIGATVVHPEIEGSQSFDVLQMTSDDTSVVTVKPAYETSRFIVEAIAPGETVLRTKGEGSDQSVPIKVLPQRFAAPTAPPVVPTASAPTTP